MKRIIIYSNGNDSNKKLRKNPDAELNEMAGLGSTFALVNATMWGATREEGTEEEVVEGAADPIRQVHWNMAERE